MNVYEDKEKYYIENQLCKPINYELGVLLGLVSIFPLISPFGLIWLSISNKNFLIRFIIGVVLTILTFAISSSIITILYVLYIIYSFVENLVVFSRILNSGNNPQKNFELEIKYKKKSSDFCFIEVSDKDVIIDEL